ncbi:MAG: trypsin-like peptidase domain-containing protein [Phycisphaeraceae bacterium]|nr:trypsin-like peptidase domain-containing protein [Phycisphaeraceae bacterium]
MPDLVERASPSVGIWKWIDFDGTVLSQATAFVVGDGLIATNHHVVAQDMRTTAFAVIQFTPEVIVGVNEGAVVYSDEARDLVLIRLERPYEKYVRIAGSALLVPIGMFDPFLPPIPLANRTPRVGEPVVCLGNPMGLGISASQGIVSALRSADDNLGQIQLSIAASPGSSGAPILDAQGHLLGLIHSTVVGGQQIAMGTLLSQAIAQGNDPLFSPSVRDWAAVTHTAAEIEAGERLFIDATSTVFADISNRITLANQEEANRVALDARNRLSADEWTRLAVALGEGAPDHFLPAMPACSSHWTHALRSLYGDDWSEQYRAQSDLAYESHTASYLSRSGMKWAASFALDSDLLRRAHAMMPHDEMIAWDYSRALLRQCKAASQNPDLTSDLGRVITEVCESNAATAIDVLSTLKEQNPLWATRSDYWHEVGMAYLLSGQVAEATESLCRRFECENGLAVMFAVMSDSRENPQYLRDAWSFAVKRGFADSADLARFANRVADVSARLPKDADVKSRCAVLQNEVKQVEGSLNECTDVLKDVNERIIRDSIGRVSARCASK